MSVTELPRRRSPEPMIGFSPLASVDQDILDAIPTAIAVFGPRGEILRINRSASNLISHAASLCQHATVPLFIGYDGRTDVIASAITEGLPIHNLEVTLDRPDGTRLNLLVDLEPLSGPSPAHGGGAVACLRDVTDARQEADAALAQQKDIEDFFENGAVGLHLVSAEGIILRANDAELKMLGYDHHEYIGQPIGHFHAEQEAIEDILCRLARGESLFRYPARLRAKNGSIKHVQITSNANFGETGFKNTRCFTVDVTDEVEASVTARQTEQKARDVLDALPAAIYTTDAEGRITFFNEAAVAFSGRRPEIGSDQWCVTWRLYEPDGTPLPHDQCPMAVSLREGRPIRGVQAIAERPDGTRVPFMPYPTPLLDAEGNVIGGINMLVDLSALEEAKEAQRVLIDELNHRVKNTLATVQSIAAQTLRSTPEPETFVANFQSRVIALAKAHDLLTRRRWTGVSLGELVDQEVVASLGPGAERLILEGPEITLAPRIGLALGMVLYELLMNARQFGALSSAAGAVQFKWALVEDTQEATRLRMSWVEYGGPAVTPPDRQGFGIRLIERSIRNDLDGSVEASFAQSGFRCEMEFLLP
ncbi:PAS domain-containing protein (plasmid) [Rhizobium indicum]|uniref:sensor histidine kinase n=1 Tax=Rhizobium indicum TaxID=2583231 RepID=UPI00110695EB|nr:HWE histidine kinase domain-containing protein [Rhizobium indicum]QKK33381.1 PAS domain-containing protein [Rhizobium indicum]